MAPLNFEKLHYFCIKDPGRADKKGNLYVAGRADSVLHEKKSSFAARVFLSCTNDGSKKWYVSRFLFDRTE